MSRGRHPRRDIGVRGDEDDQTDQPSPGGRSRGSHHGSPHDSQSPHSRGRISTPSRPDLVSPLPPIRGFSSYPAAPPSSSHHPYYLPYYAQYGAPPPMPHYIPYHSVGASSSHPPSHHTTPGAAGIIQPPLPLPSHHSGPAPPISRPSPGHHEVPSPPEQDRQNDPARTSASPASTSPHSRGSARRPTPPLRADTGEIRPPTAAADEIPDWMRPSPSTPGHPLIRLTLDRSLQYVTRDTNLEVVN